MKRTIIIVLFGGILAASWVSAQTVIPGGYVSGTWTAGGSPYLVEGDITVHADSTLTIEPAVEVNFQGYYEFLVNGFLEAVGTETDSIHFTAANTTTGWKGLRFLSAPDSSHLIYCTVRYARWSPTESGKGIHCEGSDPVISHCTISDNTANQGGGIYLAFANATISHCTISDNSVSGNGGGIYIAASTPSLSYCTVSGNSGTKGGGIYWSGPWNTTLMGCTISDNQATNYGGGMVMQNSTNVTLSECTISDNGSASHGAGIYLLYGSVNFANCTFSGNQTSGDSRGGGVCCDTVTTTFSYCTFDGNITANRGGGICAWGSNSVEVDHCTFNDNEAGLLQGDALYNDTGCSAGLSNSIFTGHTLVVCSNGTLAIDYSDFHNNTLNCTGAPPGFRVLTMVNVNGDSCDVFYNIFLDPLFVDPASGDFHIQAGSPCIDAGDPAFALDPDGTTTDIGRYYYHQTVPDIELSATSLDFDTVTVGGSANLPLTIYNVGGGDLILYDISCAMGVFTTNWDPLDSLILPGDSLEITVTFTPEDTVIYQDTLWIDNSDEMVYVELMGEGEPPPGIREGVSSSIPQKFALREPYPNPFNPTATFRIELPVTSRVNLEVFDLTGRRVAVIADGVINAGYHDAVFDASRLVSGVYLYRIQAGDFIASGKMVLLK